jgi:sugar/nucleoside kinase (ribokinase family)
MNKPRVLAIGNNTIDQVFMIESLRHHDKVSALSLQHYFGGQAANVAFTLAGLGLEVEYLGAFGDDIAGSEGRRALAAAGVRLERCPTVKYCPSHTAVLFVERSSGERTIVMYKDTRLGLTIEAVQPGSFASLDLLYIDNHEPTASLAAAQLARGKGIPVLADLEEASEQTLSILPWVTSLIAPTSVIHDLAGKDDLEGALRIVQGLGPKTVVATSGAAGAAAVHAGIPIIRVPAAACQVVDTTGAGDAFHAGFAASALFRQDFQACLSFAASLAAAKCEESGPRLTPAALKTWQRELWSRAKKRGHWL